MRRAFVYSRVVACSLVVLIARAVGFEHMPASVAFDARERVKKNGNVVFGERGTKKAVGVRAVWWVRGDHFAKGGILKRAR